MASSTCVLLLAMVGFASAAVEMRPYDLNPDSSEEYPDTSARRPCYLLGNKDQMTSPDPAAVANKKCSTKHKPYPSLTQCYKYNTESCCVSGHDATIKDKYGELLSDTCLREFPDLEYYFCLGCHPDQDEYSIVYGQSGNTCTAEQSGKAGCEFYEKTCSGESCTQNRADRGECQMCTGSIQICKPYAYKRLFPDCSGLGYDTTGAQCTYTQHNKCCWDDSKKVCLNGEPSDKVFTGEAESKVYTCENPATAGDPEEDVQAWKARAIYDNCGLNIGGEYRLPSFWFNDTAKFLDTIKPPFFENFAMRLVEPGEGEACFTSGAGKAQAGVLLAVAVALATFFQL